MATLTGDTTPGLIAMRHQQQKASTIDSNRKNHVKLSKKEPLSAAISLGKATPSGICKRDIAALTGRLPNS